MRPCLALVLVAAIAGACADDIAAFDDEPRVCTVTMPTKLADLPEPSGGEDSLFFVDDWIVFGEELWFLDADDPARISVVPRCGGDVETITAPGDGAKSFYYPGFDGAPRIYSLDQDTRRLWLLDRLDRPGVDAPVDLGPIPGDETVQRTLDRGGMTLFVAPLAGEGPRNAAGVGALRKPLFTHDGNPEHPLVSLGEVVATMTASPAWDLWTLDDAGALHRRDLPTGVAVPIQDGVRFAYPVGTTERVIWQTMTDDRNEPVYLRDLATGDDILLTQNEYTPVSWGRDPTVSAETGVWFATFDGAWLAMAGPDGRYDRVHRGTTGESVAVPVHLERRPYYTDGFWLRLADPDPDVQVDAWWRPDAGDPIVWRRGAPAEYTLDLIHGGDTIEWVEHIPPLIDGPDVWLLKSFDPKTGETTTVADVGPDRTWIDDHRLLVVRPDDGLYSERLDLVDLARDTSTTLLERVSKNWRYIPGEGVYYFDRTSAETAGLWVVPLPVDATRAHRR